MAIATAIVAFTATGADSQAFTWTPALTNPTPKVLSATATVPGGGGVNVDLPVAPTNTGGTCRLACPTTCSVLLVGSD